MDNVTPTPVQSPAPGSVAREATSPVAPLVPPAMVAAAPVVKALPKTSNKHLYILLAVFAVMAGALATVGALKPDLVTSTFGWVMNTPMHAASAESRVLVDGQWVNTANPKAALKKVEKMVRPAALKTSVMVIAPTTPVAPAVEASAPAAPAEGSPAAVAPATDEKATAPTGAFDLGTATK